MAGQLTENEIKEKLKAAFWDTNVSSDDLYAVFTNKQDKILSIDRTKIFSRLLNSYDWYTILSIISLNKLDELLKEDVLRLLWPKSISKRYYNAKRILYR